MTRLKSLAGRLSRWFASRRAALGDIGYQLWLRTSWVPIAGGADVAGPRTTGNVPANLLETDFSNTIIELEPNSTPLLVLSKRLNKTDTVNPKYQWFEDKLEARFDTVNNGPGYLSTDTAIVVANGGQWFADDLAYVTRTGETIRVVSVATNTLTVVRGVGSTAAALVNTDELINVGSAAQEGALDKPAHSDNPAEITNYTQIFRRPVDMTGTMQSTKIRTSPAEWDRQLNKKGIEHGKDIEYAALLGHPALDVTGAAPRRMTGGFNHFATQNITDVGGAMTEQELFDAIRPTMRYSHVKLAMAAMKPVDIVSAYPRSHLQITQSEETFGIRVQQVISPHGVVNFVTHFLLEGTVFANQIWLADMNNIGYRYLHGENGSRDTHVRHDIQAPGADTRKDEYLTECGFVVAQPKTHGKIINITS